MLPLKTMILNTCRYKWLLLAEKFMLFPGCDVLYILWALGCILEVQSPSADSC
jgi:hypothetical protein